MNLTEWAKSQNIDAGVALAAEHGYDVEARVLDLLIVKLGAAVGKAPLVRVQGTPAAEKLEWVERTSPHEDAVRLWLALTDAAKELPVLSDVEVSVTRVQRITIPKADEPDRWVKRTGVVVLVKGPSERERVALFLTDA